MLMQMKQSTLPRESVEYLEILSNVFADLVKRSSVARDGDITPSLAQCMEYIFLHGPSPIRKIAAGMSISVPAASQLVDRLVQRSLVTREHNSEDRRMATVELTEDGRAFIIREREDRMKWLRDILNRMSEEDRTALVNTLEDFIRLALEASGQVEEACVHCGIDHLAFCVVNKAHIEATGEPLDRY